MEHCVLDDPIEKSPASCMPISWWTTDLGQSIMVMPGTGATSLSIKVSKVKRSSLPGGMDALAPSPDARGSATSTVCITMRDVLWARGRKRRGASVPAGSWPKPTVRTFTDTSSTVRCDLFRTAKRTSRTIGTASTGLPSAGGKTDDTVMVAAVILGGLDAGKRRRGARETARQRGPSRLGPSRESRMAASRAPISGPANVATNPAALRAKSAIRDRPCSSRKAAGRPASATMAHRPAA